jgi:hypothetical protein
MANDVLVPDILETIWISLASMITVIQILWIFKSSQKLKEIQKNRDIVAGSVTYWQKELERQRQMLQIENSGLQTFSLGNQDDVSSQPSA